MKEKTPCVNFTSRLAFCDSEILWDDESSVLTISLYYQDENEAKERNQINMIDESFGIGKDDYRIIIGDVELLLDADQRVKILEVRSNPSNWQRVSLPNLPGNIEEVLPNFDVEYDENNIDSYNVPIQIMHDTTQRQIALIFANYVTSKWAKIANGLTIGVTTNHFLSEFRLLEFEPPQK